LKLPTGRRPVAIRSSGNNAAAKPRRGGAAARRILDFPPTFESAWHSDEPWRFRVDAEPVILPALTGYPVAWPRMTISDLEYVAVRNPPPASRYPLQRPSTAE